MNEITVFRWQNENSLSPYPLSTSTGFDGLLTDANFVQFDNFIPILTSITAQNNQISFTIQFDTLLKTIVVNKSDLTGVPFAVTIRDNTRYLGKIVLGSEAIALYDQLASRVLEFSIPFLPFLVKSIPSNCGVYKIDSFYGNLHFTSDNNISFAVSGQNITFNAVKIPDLTGVNYLKTINSVVPVDNNIFLKDSELIKFDVAGTAAVGISLTGTGITDLLAEQNSVIPTNLDPS